jgi:hypothetical protein
MLGLICLMAAQGLATHFAGAWCGGKEDWKMLKRLANESFPLAAAFVAICYLRRGIVVTANNIEASCVYDEKALTWLIV